MEWTPVGVGGRRGSMMAESAQVARDRLKNLKGINPELFKPVPGGGNARASSAGDRAYRKSKIDEIRMSVRA